MYFITIDVDNVVTGLYDGSTDFVHRVTGAPMAGAMQLPDGSIPIMDACYQCIVNSPKDQECVWNGTEIILQPASTLENKQKSLVSKLAENYTQAEVVRVAGLTEAEVDAELGAV